MEAVRVGDVAYVAGEARVVATIEGDIIRWMSSVNVCRCPPHYQETCPRCGSGRRRDVNEGACHADVWQRWVAYGWEYL